MNKVRRLSPGEGLLLFLMGLGFSQFANILVGLFQNVLNYQQYQQTMDQITFGKNILTMIFWMGIVAPIAEEVVFRWLIYLRLRDYMRTGAAILISAAFFGIYHMNLIQAVYAGILGAVFAYFLEITGSIWASGPASYGCQYLVAGIYGGGAMASGEKSFLDTADLCDALCIMIAGNRIFPAEA